MNNLREKQKLLKELNRGKGKYYLLILFVILTFIYIVDEISSNINTTLQPYVILDLFRVPGADVNSKEYASALGKFTVITMFSYVMMLIAPFYKALADRFGRRLFLILNTTLMSVGMLICMIAPHYIVYIIGALVITFVKSNDMQVMYIIETAPKEHRAKICNTTKAIALVSVSLIGVFKMMFFRSSDITTWRMVFLIPVIIGLVVSVIAIPFIRETPVFIEKRLSALGEKTEQRDTGSKTIGDSLEKPSETNGGVGKAFKLIFSDKQLRNIMIASVAFALVTGITSYYMTVLEASRQTGVITEDVLNLILVIFPFVNGIFTMICGFISDSAGRKKACFIFSAIAGVGLVMFVLGAYFGAPSYIIGIGYGMFIGTLWSITDTLVLVMPAESTPTNMRASVMGVMSLLLSAGMAISIILFALGVNIVGSKHIGMLSIAICIPLMILSCILLSKVEETKGNDLDEI